METIKILFIEDDASQRELFNDAVGNFRTNQANAGYSLDITSRNSVDADAYKSLLQWVDFLIVDLRIPNEWDGNGIIDVIRGANIVPISVVTWHRGELTDQNETVFYRIYDKWSWTGNIYDQVLGDIRELYDTSFSKVLWRHGKTNEILKSLVWGSGLNNIKEWSKFNNLGKAEKSLSRHIISYLHHALSEDYSDFHTEETYLKNLSTVPIYDTWVILEKDGNNYIILTPACDLAHGDPDYLIAKISPPQSTSTRDMTELDSLWALCNETEDANRSQKIEDFRNKMQKLTRSDAKRTRFLPRSSFFPGGFINFQKIQVVQSNKINEYNIVCILSPLFLKDIVADFWYYYGRQGQPDLDHGIMLNTLRPRS